MYMRLHERHGERMVALCDSGLLGKRFEGGGLVLDLGKHSDFYKGERVGEEEAVAALKRATSVNVVGERSVAAAKRAGIISGKEVVLIGGVPHCQAYRV